MSKADEFRKKLGIDGMKKFEMKYGFTEDHIVVQFGTPIDNLTMSLENTDAMLATLTECRNAFVKRKSQ